jgi:hypothetical protein
VSCDLHKISLTRGVYKVSKNRGSTLKESVQGGVRTEKTLGVEFQRDERYIWRNCNTIHISCIDTHLDKC